MPKLLRSILRANIYVPGRIAINNIFEEYYHIISSDGQRTYSVPKICLPASAHINLDASLDVKEVAAAAPD